MKLGIVFLNFRGGCDRDDRDVHDCGDHDGHDCHVDYDLYD